MRLSVDERGVNFEFEAPNCDLGDRCLEMVRRGDYSGCSFEFMPKDYEVERTKGADGKDEVKIIHKEFEFISALTIGMDPAYRQTTVNAREIGVQETDEQRAQREADEAAKRAQQEKEEREQEAARDAEYRRRKLEIDHLIY